MKNQVLFAVLALFAVNISCAVIEPVKVEEPVELVDPAELIEYYEEVRKANEEADESVQVIESFEEVELVSDITPNVFSALIQPRNSVLFRGVYRRSAVANTVHVHRITYNGRASTRISSVRGRQMGTNQGASARVAAGGVGRNFVTVELRSARGRGFHIQVEIWGRF